MIMPDSPTHPESNSMRIRFFFAAVFFAAVSLRAAQPLPLFNGQSLEGWSFERKDMWRVEDGAIVGGNLDKLRHRLRLRVSEGRVREFRSASEVRNWKAACT